MLACTPCTTSDPGCTSPGTATQDWCDERCTAGQNDANVCPRSHCYCHTATPSVTTTTSNFYFMYCNFFWHALRLIISKLQIF